MSDRETLPAPVVTPRDVIDSVPTRFWPVCSACGGYVKLGGDVDDTGGWHHDICGNEATGRNWR